MTKSEIKAPIVIGRIFKPKKKESDGRNKVLVPISANIQIRITIQNKPGSLIVERSIRASLLSATSSDFLMMSVYMAVCRLLWGSIAMSFREMLRHNIWVLELPSPFCNKAHSSLTMEFIYSNSSARIGPIDGSPNRVSKRSKLLMRPASWETKVWTSRKLVCAWFSKKPINKPLKVMMDPKRPKPNLVLSWVGAKMGIHCNKRGNTSSKVTKRGSVLVKFGYYFFCISNWRAHLHVECSWRLVIDVFI